MTTRIAISGFGRIGRNVLRAIWEEGATDFEVVAVNDLAPLETNAHLLRFDSVHGRFEPEVVVRDDSLYIDGSDQGIKVLSIPNPLDLPWGDLDIDIVFECTGFFTNRDRAAEHLKAGAKKVLISAPGKGADKTIVWGVNHHVLTADDDIVSNGSCTTNCLAPLAQALRLSVGLERGLMTTIHSYTGDQPMLDTMHDDLYRARAAAMAMIPTSTGAATALKEVIPELEGKLNGYSLRVPTPTVSVVDLSFVPSRSVTAEEVNEALVAAAEGDFSGVLRVEPEKLVSVDFVHDPCPSIVHLDKTMEVDDGMVKVLAWYDNEWGFPCQMIKTAREMAKLW